MVRHRFCIILNEPLVSQNLSNHGIFPKESEAISRRCSAKNVFKIFENFIGRLKCRILILIKSWAGLQPYQKIDSSTSVFL